MANWYKIIKITEELLIILSLTHFYDSDSLFWFIWKICVFHPDGFMWRILWIPVIQGFAGNLSFHGMNSGRVRWTGPAVSLRGCREKPECPVRSGQKTGDSVSASAQQSGIMPYKTEVPRRCPATGGLQKFPGKTVQMKYPAKLCIQGLHRKILKMC